MPLQERFFHFPISNQANARSVVLHGKAKVMERTAVLLGPQDRESLAPSDSAATESHRRHPGAPMQALLHALLCCPGTVAIWVVTLVLARKPGSTMYSTELGDADHQVTSHVFSHPGVHPRELSGRTIGFRALGAHGISPGALPRRLRDVSAGAVTTSTATIIIITSLS